MGIGIILTQMVRWFIVGGIDLYIQVLLIINHIIIISIVMEFLLLILIFKDAYMGFLILAITGMLAVQLIYYIIVIVVLAHRMLK